MTTFNCLPLSLQRREERIMEPRLITIGSEVVEKGEEAEETNLEEIIVRTPPRLDPAEERWRT